MTVPFDEHTLTWRTRSEDNDVIKEMQATEENIPYPNNVAYNLHHIQSKAILADYLHQAAGYPPKRHG